MNKGDRAAPIEQGATLVEIKFSGNKDLPYLEGNKKTDRVFMERRARYHHIVEQARCPKNHMSPSSHTIPPFFDPISDPISWLRSNMTFQFLTKLIDLFFGLSHFQEQPMARLSRNMMLLYAIPSIMLFGTQGLLLILFYQCFLNLGLRFFARSPQPTSPALSL